MEWLDDKILTLPRNHVVGDLIIIRSNLRTLDINPRRFQEANPSKTLKTAKAEYGGGDNRTMQIRGLLDIAHQTSFIKAVRLYTGKVYCTVSLSSRITSQTTMILTNLSCGGLNTGIQRGDLCFSSRISVRRW